ncbi:uncharacterized protein J8A68_001959 [[Candida] subhashii]|uniref:DASH complex subunit SPC34 n=1 Tax=[Candida] subhashii TaxID=561895 RepID=A0A8J5QQB1_9ASCO|nr:uncharacterized protein J8A68_001959 [[Candida] subhashii]KAG7664508.1 hypothetical protein J8A68_001959 [[Candida] subhashii]
MPPLGQILNQINQSCQSIEENEFSKPGMFANAMVNPPDITRLVLDPHPDEASLYKASKPINTSHSRKRLGYVNDTTMEVVPERIDGRSVYSSMSLSDLRHDYGEEDDDESIEDTIVKGPRFNEKRRHLSKQPYFKIDKDTDNVEELIGRVNRAIMARPSLLEKYPQYVSRLRYHQRQYEVDSEAISQLESEIVDLEDALRALENEVPQGAFDEGEVALDHLIRKEQEEIAELESRLNEEDI